MSEQKPTPGPVSQGGQYGNYKTEVVSGGRAIAAFWTKVDGGYGASEVVDWPEGRANMGLYIEAHTVHHETGLTPLQLAERLDALDEHNSNMALEAATLAAERKELLEALIEARRVVGSINRSRFHRASNKHFGNGYLQTQDWCDWAKNEVLPKVDAAIAKAGGAA